MYVGASATRLKPVGETGSRPSEEIAKRNSPFVTPFVFQTRALCAYPGTECSRTLALGFGVLPGDSQATFVPSFECNLSQSRSQSSFASHQDGIPALGRSHMSDVHSRLRRPPGDPGRPKTGDPDSLADPGVDDRGRTIRVLCGRAFDFGGHFMPPRRIEHGLSYSKTRVLPPGAPCSSGGGDGSKHSLCSICVCGCANMCMRFGH